MIYLYETDQTINANTINIVYCSF